MKHLLVLFLMFTLFCNAQNPLNSSHKSGKLPWVLGDLPSNSLTYKYKVIQGQGTNLIIARKNVIQNLAFEIGTEQGVSISSETISTIQEKVINQKSNVSNGFFEKVIIKQSGINTSFSKIDEYYEKVSDKKGDTYFKVWQLYSVGTNSNLTPRLSYTSKYGLDAGFRSAIIPGWGQFYKSKNTKGFIFMGVAVASIGSFLYSQNKYNYNINRLEESSSLELQREYSKRADNFKTYKNLSMGAAAAVWIWSIIDAVGTEGKPKYETIANGFKFNIKSSNNEAIALSLNYNF